MYLVCGEALYDVFVEPITADVRRKVSLSAKPGGSPLNVAIGLARLGCAVSFATETAADTLGRVLESRLKAEGVDCQFIRGGTAKATPLAMVEDPEHRGWTVRLGDFIGQNGGKVTGIHKDEIIVTETITDHSTGRVYPQNVKLTVLVSKDEERDLQALREGERLGPAKGEH